MLGNRVIYRATPTLGYEIDGYPQELKTRQLINGIFACKEDVEYIDITITTDNAITPTKAICLFGKYYMYNPETGVIEEEDIVDEGVEVIHANVSDVIKFEKNTYVRKMSFDCAKDNDQQSSAYQPISGLNIDSKYLTIRTHNFCHLKDEPITGDLIHYQGRFWAVEETRKTFTYLPREKSVLHIAMKQIKK